MKAELIGRKKILSAIMAIMLVFFSFFGAGWMASKLLGVNPMYPTFETEFIDYWAPRRTNRVRAGYGWQKGLSDPSAKYDAQGFDNGTTRLEQKVLNLDITNYAKSVDDFKNNYKSMNFELLISFFMYNSAKITTSASWKDISEFDASDSYKKQSFSISTLEQSEYQSIFRKVNDGSNKHSVELFYRSQFSGNYFQIYFKTEAWITYNTGSMYGHGAFIGYYPKKVTFNSSYNLEQFKKSIIQKGQKTLDYTSLTGATITSEERLKGSDFQGEWDSATGSWVPGKEPKPTGVANKKAIEALLRERAPTTFGNQWEAYKAFGLTFDLYNWDNINNTVDTVFTLNNEKFVEYRTKINLKVDQTYWDMNFLKRFEVKPGKVVDLNDVSRTMEDVPELVQKNGRQTFIYHNTVEVKFASNKNSKNERLLVNGEDAEVWQDVFQARLTDGRNETQSTVEKDNTYEVAVEVDGKIKFSRTIKINSLNPNINFKWMGWDPQNTPGDKNKYDQWLLTQEFIDGQKNDLYDPYIDPETGARIQTIFVAQKPLDDPFLIDPKDRYGQIIGGDIPDDSQRWGYFAEAYVVNKGIKYLFDQKELEEFEKIERVQINPQTFEEIGVRQDVSMSKEVQFSSPGTWHYIFHLKDHVDQSNWGNNSIHNPPLNKDITATQGTVIHKIVTLDSSDETYRRFLDLEDSKKNSKIHEWFRTAPGGHLRSFMISNGLINSQTELELIKYEEIVKYWRQYVSAAINGYMTYNPETDDRENLSDWQPIYFPMKQREEQAARDYIIRKIKTQMFSFKSSAYEKDYVIESKDGHTPFDEIDLSEFVDISDDHPVRELEVMVRAKPESLLIVGQVEFQINNDINYDPDLEINLNDVKFKNFEGAFSKWPPEVKKTFYDNYLMDYVAKSLDNYRVAKNKTLKQVPEKDDDGRPTGRLVDKFIPEYVYGKDYAIFIDGMKMDITKEPTMKEHLAEFLNAEKKQVMWVRINAVRGTTLLSGATSYKIINDPHSSAIPDPKPDPVSPDPLPTPQSSNSSGIGWNGIWWLILIPIVGLILIICFIVLKRKKRLKVFELE